MAKRRSSSSIPDWLQADVDRLLERVGGGNRWGVRKRLELVAFSLVLSLPEDVQDDLLANIEGEKPETVRKSLESHWLAAAWLQLARLGPDKARETLAKSSHRSGPSKHRVSPPTKRRK